MAKLLNMLQVLHVPTLADNYVWLIHRPGQAETLIVDPGESYPVETSLADHELRAAGILLTHHHHDHIGGVEELVRNMPCPVYGPARIPQVDQPVTPGESLHITALNLDIQVLDVGGHTHDHVAYLAEEHLFCGDALFSAGCGRIFDGTANQMAGSMARLRLLPDTTQIHCAHEYTASNLRFALTVEPTNLNIHEYIQIVTNLRAQGLPSLPSSMKTEKLVNPFLRTDQGTVIASTLEHFGLEDGLNETDIFTHLRRWKDGFQ
ncbi:MAG: hydroxyacylglutathione hydrolase [Gammaproteobacteria bacterium]|nr:hydroxyacylglutathione hydrolase [Gammaproteobacteria bacterium]